MNFSPAIQMAALTAFEAVRGFGSLANLFRKLSQTIFEGWPLFQATTFCHDAHNSKDGLAHTRRRAMRPLLRNVSLYTESELRGVDFVPWNETKAAAILVQAANFLIADVKPKRLRQNSVDRSNAWLF